MMFRLMLRRSTPSQRANAVGLMDSGMSIFAGAVAMLPPPMLFLAPRTLALPASMLAGAVATSAGALLAFAPTTWAADACGCSGFPP